MCYFLYGAINDGINVDDYEKTIKDDFFSYYFLLILTEISIKNS